MPARPCRHCAALNREEPRSNGGRCRIVVGSQPDGPPSLPAGSSGRARAAADRGGGANHARAGASGRQARADPVGGQAGLRHVHQGATRATAGADRAVSRLAAVAGADGGHLPGRRGRGRQVVQGQQGHEGRRRRASGAEPVVGSGGAVAGRVPAGAAGDGRPARLGAEPRRRVSGLVERRARRRAAPAHAGAASRQPQVQRAAEGDRRGGRAPADGDQDRAGAARRDLRAGLQPDVCLRHLAVSVLPAVLLAALLVLLPGLLPRRGIRRRRVLGRCGRLHPLGRLQLGWRRHQHQHRPLQPDQPQPPDRPRPEQVPAQRRQPQGCAVPRPGQPRSVWQGRRGRRGAQQLPRP